MKNQITKVSMVVWMYEIQTTYWCHIDDIKVSLTKEGYFNLLDYFGKSDKDGKIERKDDKFIVTIWFLNDNDTSIKKMLTPDEDSFTGSIELEQELEDLTEQNRLLTLRIKELEGK